MASHAFFFRADERETVDRVAQALIGQRATRIKIDPSATPTLDFQSTPQPLIDSYLTSDRIEELTRPGDTVLMSDAHGLAGVFILRQLYAAPSQRRKTVIVAASSRLLEAMRTTGTVGDLGQPWDSEVDWETAAYRFADRILAPSQIAFDILSAAGFQPETIALAPSQPVVAPQLNPAKIQLVGPITRLNQSGSILRALSSTTFAVRISAESEPDSIWSGTTWDALRSVRTVMEDQLTTTGRPDIAALVSPFHITDHPKRTPTVVLKGSANAAVLPDAATFAGPDELVDGLTTGHWDQADVVSPSTFLMESGSDGPPHEISVGIPVFGNYAFLADTLKSLAAQTIPISEILIGVDGTDPGPVREITSAYDNVEVIPLPHKGVCATRNTLLHRMSGSAFLFVDGDDLLEPTFLEKTDRVLRTESNIWAVATWTMFFGEYEAVEAKPVLDRRTAFRENPIISTCALVDMSVRDLGIEFEPDLAFIFCEDWDFWAQIVAQGGSFGLVPEPLALHRVHQASGGFQRLARAETIGRARVRDRFVQS